MPRSPFARPALALLAAVAAAYPSGAQEKVPPVTAPPESFFEKVGERDRNAASKFYAKYIDIRRVPVVASAEVDDEALRRTYVIVT
ncbi:MAG TPA: hypothetical protein VIL46_02760, partial [Gemmataceae bacterium]